MIIQDSDDDDSRDDGGGVVPSWQRVVKNGEKW
jgi:hypothetical protein